MLSVIISYFCPEHIKELQKALTVDIGLYNDRPEPCRSQGSFSLALAVMTVAGQLRGFGHLLFKPRLVAARGDERDISLCQFPGNLFAGIAAGTVDNDVVISVHVQPPMLVEVAVASLDRSW